MPFTSHCLFPMNISLTFPYRSSCGFLSRFGYPATRSSSPMTHDVPCGAFCPSHVGVPEPATIVSCPTENASQRHTTPSWLCFSRVPGCPRDQRKNIRAEVKQKRKTTWLMYYIHLQPQHLYRLWVFQDNLCAQGNIIYTIQYLWCLWCIFFVQNELSMAGFFRQSSQS